jgi:hypothetical protein
MRFVLLSWGAGIVAATLASSVALGQQGRPKLGHDAVAEAQSVRDVRSDRPEQQRSVHDESDVFLAPKALFSSQALAKQPDQGQILGVDFYRDPLNSPRPMMTFVADAPYALSHRPAISTRGAAQSVGRR